MSTLITVPLEGASKMYNMSNPHYTDSRIGELLVLYGAYQWPSRSYWLVPGSAHNVTE